MRLRTGTHWQHATTTLVVVLQARRHQRRRHLAQRRTSSLRARQRSGDSGLSAYGRPVAASDQVLPTLPGPHGQRRRRRPDGDRRVPVAVPTPALELQHRRRQLRLRTGHRPRYATLHADTPPPGSDLYRIVDDSYNYDLTAVRLPFDCNSTALRPFNVTTVGLRVVAALNE